MIRIDYLRRAMLGQPGTPIEVTVTSASAQSVALAKATMYIFQSDIVCHVLFGTNPTATTSSFRMAANVPYYFTAQAASKVAAIRGGTDDGTLQMTPMTGDAE